MGEAFYAIGRQPQFGSVQNTPGGVDHSVRADRAGTEDLALRNDAVKIDATVLYADLDESTNLVNSNTAEFAAEIYKIYLACAARIIRNEGGVITGYDGDRIMAVFIGRSRNSTAAQTGLKINHAVLKIINPAIRSVYRNSTYSVKHQVGIDSSDLFAARTGIRGANDLVWVGRAANYAAKLSARTGGRPLRLRLPCTTGSTRTQNSVRTAKICGLRDGQRNRRR